MSDAGNDPRTDSHETRLSLAVVVVDGFTGERLVEGARVTLEDEGANPLRTEPVKKPDGYRLFLDLPDTTVHVSVDGGKRYLKPDDQERPEVIPSELWSQWETDGDEPIEVIELTPSAAYDFPAGSTLIRGHVFDSEGEGLAEATLSIPGVGNEEEMGVSGEGETDERGQFMLFFNGVSPDNVERENGRRLVKVDGENPTVEVSHPNLGPEPVPVGSGDEGEREGIEVEEGRARVEIVEGKTTILTLNLFQGEQKVEVQDVKYN